MGGATMARIEIHGVTHPNAIENLRNLICGAMIRAQLDGDAITTVNLQSDPKQCSDNSTLMPFLLVASPDRSEIGQVRQALENANIYMDVEELVLGGFSEARSEDQTAHCDCGNYRTKMIHAGEHWIFPKCGKKVNVKTSSRQAPRGHM